jgi:hypothetical protein
MCHKSADASRDPVQESNEDAVALESFTKRKGQLLLGRCKRFSEHFVGNNSKIGQALLAIDSFDLDEWRCDQPIRLVCQIESHHLFLWSDLESPKCKSIHEIGGTVVPVEFPFELAIRRGDLFPDR